MKTRTKNDVWKVRYQVHSFSNPSKQYTVSVHRDGHYACSCPDYKFRRTGPDYQCKHIRALKRAPSTFTGDHSSNHRQALPGDWGTLSVRAVRNDFPNEWLVRIRMEGAADILHEGILIAKTIEDARLVATAIATQMETTLTDESGRTFADDDVNLVTSVQAVGTWLEYLDNSWDGLGAKMWTTPQEAADDMWEEEFIRDDFHFTRMN